MYLWGSQEVALGFRRGVPGAAWETGVWFMATIQQELWAQAQELVTEHLAQDELFRSVWEEIMVLLAGSAPTEFADRFSSIDLIAVFPDEVYDRVEQDLVVRRLVSGRADFQELVWERLPFKFAVFRESQLTTWLQDYDDFILGLLLTARPIHDPRGVFPSLVGAYRTYPRQVLNAKIQDRYAELRRRQASMAWNLRRGQPFAFLDNLVRFMSHVFVICFYLEGRPPVGKKWLFRGAMRTEVGRALRPMIYELFGLLGDVATLGGTIHVRTSRLYTQLAAIQEYLADVIKEKGFDVG